MKQLIFKKGFSGKNNAKKIINGIYQMGYLPPLNLMGQ